LRLEHTYYAATEETPPVVQGYRQDHTGVHNVTQVDLPQLVTAAGCVVADIADVQRFAQALFGGKLLTAGQWAELTDFTKLDDDEDYGLGLARYTGRGWVRLGHRGETFGYKAAMFYCADSGAIVLALANLSSADLDQLLEVALHAVYPMTQAAAAP
jgi:D-alanyl-D-alanine carboxypeptidase